METLDAILQLRAVYVWGGLSGSVSSTAVAAVALGAMVSDKRPAIRGLSTTDTRAKPLPRPTPGDGGAAGPAAMSFLAAAAHARTVAARDVERLHAAEDGGSPHQTAASTAQRGHGHMPPRSALPFFALTRDQAWATLRVRKWAEVAMVDWAAHRAVAARLVALESIAAMDDADLGGQVAWHPNVLAANLELGTSYFMLGAHDLAAEVGSGLVAALRERQGGHAGSPGATARGGTTRKDVTGRGASQHAASVTTAATSGAGLPPAPLLVARAHLFVASCLAVDAPVDRNRVKKHVHAALACDVGDPVDADALQRVALAVDTIALLHSPEPASARLAERGAIVDALGRAVQAGNIVIAAERVLSAPAATHIKLKLEREMREATNDRERRLIEDQLTVEAAALRDKGQRLMLKINEHAATCARATTEFLDAVRAAPGAAEHEVVRALCGEVILTAGKAQWAASRHREASHWFTMAAALYEPPSLVHVFARWAIVMTEAKAAMTTFAADIGLEAAATDPDFISQSTDQAAAASSGTVARRGRRVRGGSDSDYSSDSEKSYDGRAPAPAGSKNNNTTNKRVAAERVPPHEALLRVWPDGHRARALAPYLRVALLAASGTPEGMADPTLAAHAAVATVDTFGRECTQSQRALQAFENRSRRVPIPRAQPSWGVLEVLQEVKLTCADPTAKILYALAGYPGNEDDEGTATYGSPIVLTETGRATLRMVSVSRDGRRSGVVELHYTVVLPSR